MSSSFIREDYAIERAIEQAIEQALCRRTRPSFTRGSSKAWSTRGEV